MRLFGLKGTSFAVLILLLVVPVKAKFSKCRGYLEFSTTPYPEMHSVDIDFLDAWGRVCFEEDLEAALLPDVGNTNFYVTAASTHLVKRLALVRMHTPDDVVGGICARKLCWWKGEPLLSQAPAEVAGGAGERST